MNGIGYADESDFFKVIIAGDVFGIFGVEPRDWA